MKLTALILVVTLEVAGSIGLAALGWYAHTPPDVREGVAAYMAKEACGPVRSPLAGWVPGAACPKQ